MASRHIRGKAARWSTIPTVKAYRGALPPGAAGIEFTTEVPETVGVGTPSTALWYRGSPGVRDLSDDWVYIPVRITRKVP